MSPSISKPDAAIGPSLLGALMRMPVDVIRGRMLEDLHRSGFDDLTQAHTAVFGYPGPDGLRPIALADQTGMSKQALNYLLSQLEEGGYLERRDDPDDHRSKRIHLTRRGFEAIETMRNTVARIEDEFASEYGAAALESLRSHLLDLNRLLETEPPGPS